MENVNQKHDHNHEHNHNHDHKNKKHKKHNHEHEDHEHDGGAEHDHSHGLKSGWIDWRIKLFVGFLFLIPAIWIMSYNFSGGTVYIPDVILNPIFQMASGTFILLLLDWGTLVSAYGQIKSRKIGSDTTLSLSLLVAYIYSLSLFIFRMSGGDFSSEGYFFDAVIEISVIIFIGGLVDDFVIKRTTSDITEINKMFVKKTMVKDGDTFVEKQIEDVKVGDIVLVKAGDTIPLDGVVLTGETEINESSFTGESIPVHKIKDSFVYGGSISINGTIEVKVLKIASETEIAKIVKGIEATKQAKPKAQSIADGIAKYFLPMLVLVSVTGFLFWGFLATWTEAISVLVTTLIVACPMAFVLITPFATLFANQKAIKSNIKFQSKNLFEDESKIDVIVFDKTGTITEGKMSIIENTIPKEMEGVLYTLENNSNHAISTSIVETLFKDKEIKEVEGTYGNLPGKGASLKIDDETTYFIGSYKFLKSVITDYELEDRKPGEIMSFLFDNKNNVYGYIKLKDTVKKTSKKAISLFKKMGIETVMITGDNKANAEQISTELGIDKYYAETSPTQKAEIVKEFQEKGRKVLFVGDGINDALAIESATIGISMDSGTSLTKTTSDIISLDNDLLSIVNSLKIINRANMTIKVGLAISVIWIFIIVAVSLFGLLNPALGAVAMVINDILPLLYGINIKYIKLEKP